MDTSVQIIQVKFVFLLSYLVSPLGVIVLLGLVGCSLGLLVGWQSLRSLEGKKHGHPCIKVAGVFPAVHVVREVCLEPPVTHLAQVV